MLTKRTGEALGLSMLISAASLSAAALVLNCKKRGALMALAAVEGGIGAYLLTQRRVCRVRGQVCEDELFDEAECREAERRIRGVLGSRHNDDAAPRVLHEILRDEEATEADFQ